MLNSVRFYSGKSTFINYLANYFKRGSIDNPRVAIPTRFRSTNMGYNHNENFVADVTKSKTTTCYSYTFELQSVKFHIVDTPGINDTGGLCQDNQNMENILSYIQRLPEITALILVINGAVCRATVNICYALRKFQERLPDIIYGNLLIILTNCQSHSVNFNPEDLGLSKGCAVFYMQNSAFSTDPRKWSQQTRDMLEIEFQKSMETFNSIVGTLCRLEGLAITCFKDMNDNRNNIKRELHAVRLMLLDLQNMEDELIGYELSAHIHSSNVEKFRDFIQTKTITRHVAHQTGHHSTTCSSCNKVCHKSCSPDENSNVGNNILHGCSAKQDGFCKICRCPIRLHYYSRITYNDERRTIQEAIRGLQQRHEDAKAEKEKALLKCNAIQDAKKIVDNELKNQYEKIKENIEELRKTCSKTSVVNELYDFIVCLKNDVQQLKQRSVIRKAEAIITDLEKLCKGFENTETRSNITTEPQQSVPTHTNTLEVPATQQPAEETGDDECPSTVRTSESVQNHQALSICSSSQTNGEASQNNVKDVAKIKAPGEMNLNAFTLSELIEISKVNNSADVRKELNNRIHGKTVGLLSNRELFSLCESFVHCRSENVQTLLKQKNRIEEDINKATDYDLFQIEKVDPETLLRLVAVNLLLSPPDEEEEER
ncbi:unnamed protein product [Adineta ricciae]|uniref:G domain-containing protein n=1 Tax=Adineta ricciae TaxID=249248 RepID=A0A815HHB4_ADIRI|nr:unnamed protein product [Adineta ricciae]CAF1477488.1 unnamed protein product [Adineta ricciae]